MLAKQVKQSTGTASFTAKKDGRHEYCFSNMMSSIADKTVRCARHALLPQRNTDFPLPSFNIHGVIYISEDGA